MKTAAWALVVVAGLLALVPGVLVVIYPNWGEKYYFAVAMTAALYATAVGTAALYCFMEDR